MAKLAYAKPRRTTHAECARYIRKELKAAGLKAKVRCMTYSMGSSVYVTLIDPRPGIVRMWNLLLDKYQYGHFDGMTDSYNYDNSRDELPQVKHVSVQANYSPEILQLAEDWCKSIKDNPERERDRLRPWRAMHMEEFWAEAVDPFMKSRDSEHSEVLGNQKEINMVWAVADKASRKVVGTFATRGQARAARQPGQVVGKEEEFAGSTPAEGSTTVAASTRKRSAGSTRVTMKEQARTIVGEVIASGGGRKQAIERLSGELGMSRPYASTYFYLVK